MSIDSFIPLVREYVALVDRCESLTAHAFVRSCVALLPQIYAAGINLPEVELTDWEKESPEPALTSPMSKISSLLGKYDEYAEVFDPVFDRDPLVTVLSDDLADIYFDLRRPLELYDSSTEASEAEAIWQWRFNMVGHCGDHLVDALRPLHRLAFDHMTPEYKNENGL